jgi:hypothetical protein
MNKIIMMVFVFLFLVGTVFAGLGVKNFIVDRTDISILGYEVDIQGYEGYTLVFNISEVSTDNIVSKIDERLIIIDAVEDYNNDVKLGRSGCTFTSWCRNNGWSNDTTCHKGRCVDEAEKAEIDGLDDKKKDDLDDVLGA